MRVLTVVQLLWQAQLSDPSELNRWPSSRLMNSERAERERRPGFFFFFFHGANLVQQPRLVSACRCPGEMVAFKRIKVNCVCAEPVLCDILALATRQLLAPALKEVVLTSDLDSTRSDTNSSVQTPKRREGFPSYLGGFCYFLNSAVATL